MGKTHKEEFQHELKLALLALLSEGNAVIALRDLNGDAFAEDEQAATAVLMKRIESIVENLTADWNVNKGAPSGTEHPLYDGPDLVHFTISTPARELNDAEKAAKQKSFDRWRWIHGDDHSTPPPADVSVFDLLRQKVWWDNERKLTDLTPGLRLRALKYFKANAEQMRNLAPIRYVSCPDDGVFEGFMDGDAWETFLSGEPQVVELLRLIELDRKRPCGFCWGDREGVGDEPCLMSGDHRHHCGRKHSHGKPHSCSFCRAKRDRTAEDTPPPADSKLSDLLDQSVWWVTRKGEVLKLVDMEPSHRAHALAYLKRNADQIMHNVVGRYMTEDAPDDVKVAFMKTSYADMLADTPLVKWLTVLVSGDVQDGAS